MQYQLVPTLDYPKYASSSQEQARLNKATQVIDSSILPPPPLSLPVQPHVYQHPPYKREEVLASPLCLQLPDRNACVSICARESRILL